jgi:hypothetical protein
VKNNKMFEENFKKGISDLKKLELTSEEKGLLFNNIENYINKNNIIPKKQVSYFVNFFSYNHSRFVYMSLFMFVFLGGGVLLASDSALPGEVLYTIKINVAEPLRGVSIVSSVSKIDWETEKIERRIEEFEVLVARNNLSDKDIEKAEKRLENSTDSFNLALQKKEQSGDLSADFARDNLENKIDVHSRVLEKLENNSGSTQKNQIAKLRKNIEDKKNKISKKDVMLMTTSLSKSNSGISTSSLEEKEKVLESLIKNTEKNLKNKNKTYTKPNNKLKQDIISDTEKDLDQAKNSLEEARRKKNSGNLEEASSDLESSEKQLKNTDIFFNQSIKLLKERYKYDRENINSVDSND